MGLGFISLNSALADPKLLRVLGYRFWVLGGYLEQKILGKVVRIPQQARKSKRRGLTTNGLAEV